MLNKSVVIKVRITQNHKTKIVNINETIPYICETENDVLWHIKNDLQFVIKCINGKLMIDGFTAIRIQTEKEKSIYFK